MDSHIWIKAILIIVFVALGWFLVMPGRGERHAALRRLLLIAVFVLAALAVIFPSLATAVAHAVGVGRGADLLLYGLIVVFIGNAVVQQRRLRQLQTELTKLMRRFAISQAERPDAGPSDGPNFS